MKYESQSVEETKTIAHEFASTLVGGDIVFLEGDLGAGKTTFVQGVLESLGYTEPVRSPTFSIMNVYEIKRGLGTPPISRVIHLDFYRFESPEEIRSLGLEEMMENTQNVFMIEWPEKGLSPFVKIDPTIRIAFTALSSSSKEIEIKKST